MNHKNRSSLKGFCGYITMIWGTESMEKDSKSYSEQEMEKVQNTEEKEGQKPDKKTVIRNIQRNYHQLEKSIVEQLYMAHEIHGVTIGTMREEVWKSVFEMMIPKKFVIEHSIFIIDSKDGVSHEVDLAIIDETYTPYILRCGKIKFVPIEAVAAVIECKSKKFKPEAVSNWCESIENLETCNQSIARFATGVIDSSPFSQKATRPIRILCTLKKINIKNETTEYSKLIKRFDFVMTAIEANEKKKEEPHIEIITNTSYKDLWDWHRTLNFYKQDDVKRSELEELADKWDLISLEDKFPKINKKESGTDLLSIDQYEVLKKSSSEVKVIKNDFKKLAGIKLEDYQVFQESGNKNISLLSFDFQFNQLLMLINNPMPFPHMAYSKMLNDKDVSE